MPHHVVTRFAPSPTGNLHIGSLKPALYNYLFAKKMGGKCILRIEDTDRKRFVKESDQGILGGLAWAGLQYDEGPIRQSERLPIYREAALALVEAKKAYYCFCTPRELAAAATLHEQRGEAPRYNKKCRFLDDKEVAAKLEAQTPFVIRLNVPETGSTSFIDKLRGEITVPNATIDDQVLLKSDGFPTYHLAVVVDDHAMHVTHIIRADEWIPSTPKHILLYQAFGWEVPIFIHIPPIQGMDKKKKLSKRYAATAVYGYRDEGYLPEAVLNYILLLGWNPGTDQELFTREEMIAQFSLERLQKAGAAFDPQKLDWFNQQYLMKLSEEDFRQRLDAYLRLLSPEVIKKIAMAEKFITGSLEEKNRLCRLAVIERFRSATLKEAAVRAGALFALPEYDPDLLVWKKLKGQSDAFLKTKDTLELVKKYIESLSKNDFSSIHSLETTLKTHIEKNGWGVGDTLWPLRVALSHAEKSPSPFELLWALGKEESLQRIEGAIVDLKE